MLKEHVCLRDPHLIGALDDPGSSEWAVCFYSGPSRTKQLKIRPSQISFTCQNEVSLLVSKTRSFKVTLHSLKSDCIVPEPVNLPVFEGFNDEHWFQVDMQFSSTIMMTTYTCVLVNMARSRFKLLDFYK